MTDPIDREAPASPAEAGAGPAVAHRDAGHRAITDAIHDCAIFTLDDAGCLTGWSAGSRTITGYEDDEVLGRPYTIFGARDNAGDAARLLQSARDTGRFHQERWWRRRDAGLIWVDEKIYPKDEGGFVVVACDLTERVNTEDRLLADRTQAQAGLAREEAGHAREHSLRSELQAAERRAAFLAEASSILVATSLDFDSTLRALVRLTVSRLADWCVIHSLDGDGRMRRAAVAHRDPQLEGEVERVIDEAFGDSWEQTVRSVVGTGQSQILGGEVTAGWLAECTRAADELIDRMGCGSTMVAPLMGRGTVVGALTLVNAASHGEYDEEDLGLAEELGRRAAIALDNARLYRAAQEANRAKADFLAVISHELRTPLNAIMGYSDLLDAEVSGGLTDKQRRQISRIRASARHLLQLIEEILSFARIESGGEEIRLDLVDAGELAAEAAAVIEPLAEAKGLRFQLEIEDPGVMIETDAGKARQVLVNLLSNAAKFTERGSVTLRFHAEADRAIYDVIDTGVGIPEEQVSRIFDPFWQVERPNTRRAGGTGLGLSVSRRYTRLLHGRISVDSQVGSGTQFRVALPLRRLSTPSEE